MPEIKTCPSAQALALFAQGKLPEAQAVTVANHLETCADCRKAAGDLPPGSFEGKVRAAKPGNSSLPAPRPGGAPSVMGKAPAPSAPPANVPPQLANHPKFRIIRELGRGGMGVIYLAEHRVMEKPVALKVISPAVLDNPQALARFHAEARAAGKLDHQNIARAYDADQAGNLHFLVMEFVEGQSLAQLLEKRGPRPVANACHYVRQAAVGLQHAHEKGMVHRDIKPQNLMLTPQGQVKVLDFGLARVQSEPKGGNRLTQLDSFMGTPEYVAPEQATDAREADIRADIYSLGCTLYALLAGRPPFEGTLVNVVMAHIEKEAQPLHELRPDVPPELSAVVAKMLAKDPAQRYQQPIEVAQALVRFVKAGAKPGAASGVSVPPVASAGTGTRVGGNTSRVKGIGGGVSKVLAQAVPAAVEEEKGSPFAGLADAPAAAPESKRAKKERNEAKPAPTAWWKRRAVLAGAGVAVLLAVVIPWAAGVFKVKTKDGTIVLENLAADAEVFVDGDNVSVKWGEDGKTAQITVVAGSHKIVAKTDGIQVIGEEVEIKDGDRQVLTATFRDNKPIRKAGNEQGDEKWIQEVAAMRPAAQVKAVADKLKERNPDFDGAVTPTIENGCVTGLEFVTDDVTDISPLRALPALKSLSCNGSGRDRGKLTDLSPLKAIHLTKLDCYNNPLSDLSQLKGMKLTTLRCGATKVTDLSPLKDMNLTELDFDNTAVADLSPLKNLPLTGLDFGGTKVTDLSPLKGMRLTTLQMYCLPIADLSPLKDMKLVWLRCSFMPVSDLSPLKDMKLVALLCDGTQVSDLSPLKDMKLTSLNCGGTRVSDLSPLKGMPLTWLGLSGSGQVHDLTPLQGMQLESIEFTPNNITKGIDVVRQMKSLQKIGPRGGADRQFPPEEFWRRCDAGEFKPYRVADAIEAEELKVLGKSGDFWVGPQEMFQFPDGKWSGDAQLWASPMRKDEWVDLELPVSADGKYHVVAYMTKAWDYGIVQVSLNGKALAEPIDGFNSPAVISTGGIDLGTAELKKGTVTLRVEVVGTNEKSVGQRYGWGLDCVVLRPVQ